MPLCGTSRPWGKLRSQCTLDLVHLPRPGIAKCCPHRGPHDVRDVSACIVSLRPTLFHANPKLKERRSQAGHLLPVQQSRRIPKKRLPHKCRDSWASYFPASPLLRAGPFCHSDRTLGDLSASDCRKLAERRYYACTVRPRLQTRLRFPECFCRSYPSFLQRPRTGQLTDAGPSETPGLTGRVTGQPFGGTPGSPAPSRSSVHSRMSR